MLGLRVRFAVLAGLAALAALGACGGDRATAPPAPTSVSAADALASLAHAMAGTGTSVIPAGSTISSGTLAALPTAAIGQVSVRLDGAPATMFALASRTVFPAGTCLEQLVSTPGTSFGATCTPPPGGLVLVLWQTQSATVTPDRIIVVLADVGNANFSDVTSFASASGAALPPVALYLERSGAMWLASSGSLQTSFAVVPGACPAPPVAFVAAATCSLARFTSVGQITFSPFLAASPATSGHTLDMTALTSIPGIVTNVSAVVANH